jgi:hypothetical protein
MPWPMLPFAARGTKEAISRALNVEGIPTLVVLDSTDGTVICGDARARVETSPAAFPWAPALVERVDDATSLLNSQRILVAFTDKLTDAAADERVNAILARAARHVLGAEGDATVAAGGAALARALRAAPVRAVLATEDDELAMRVRTFLGLQRDKDGASSARFVVLDVPEQGAAIFGGKGAAPAVPEEGALLSWLDEVIAGRVELTPLDGGDDE